MYSRTGIASRLVLVLALLAAVSLAFAGTVYVQPIQVCNDSGANCADSSRELYTAAIDKIWDQAGIDVVFMSWLTYDSSTYLTIDSEAELYALWAAAGNGASSSATVVSMWFVDSISLSPSTTTYGASEWASNGSGGYGGNRITISDDIFPVSRIDTIAHELGHELGLDHYDTLYPSATDIASNLMTSGTYRSVPSSIDNITPDGSKLDQLNNVQIAIALTSDLIMPEPASAALVGIALIGLVLRRRRAARKS
jgi:hypothetical protein